MDLVSQTERLKLRFIGAYEKLRQQGLITDEEMEEVIEIIDHLDDYGREQLVERLARLRGLQARGD
ncbi:MAG: hypothetical protein ACOYD6_08280 [Limnochordia bacterium]|jgi:hypothetical protein